VLRGYANLCDLLDLTGELERAATLALRGVEEARQAGREDPGRGGRGRPPPCLVRRWGILTLALGTPPPAWST